MPNVKFWNSFRVCKFTYVLLQTRLNLDISVINWLINERRALIPNEWILFFTSPPADRLKGLSSVGTSFVAKTTRAWNWSLISFLCLCAQYGGLRKIALEWGRTWQPNCWIYLKSRSRHVHEMWSGILTIIFWFIWKMLPQLDSRSVTECLWLVQTVDCLVIV